MQNFEGNYIGVRQISLMCSSLCRSGSSSSYVMPMPCGTCEVSTHLHIDRCILLILLGASLDVVTCYCDNRFSVLLLARCEALWEISRSLISPQSFRSLNKSGKLLNFKRQLAPSPSNYTLQSFGGIYTWSHSIQLYIYIYIYMEKKKHLR